MLLPNWLPGFWLKVISQPWEGDITMVLPSMVWQVKKAISNPSKQELYQSLKQVLVNAHMRSVDCAAMPHYLSPPELRNRTCISAFCRGRWHELKLVAAVIAHLLHVGSKRHLTAIIGLRDAG
jgi:hypothetical protein